MRGVEQIPWLYDLGMALLEATGLGRWRRWLVSGVESGRVLDVGCGTGRNLALLDQRTRAIGIDPCFDSLLRARGRAPHALLVQARAETLPFGDGVFDSAIDGLVFCSVGDVPAGLGELARVLRPGGDLRMLEHARSSHAWQAWLQDLAQPAWTAITGGCHPNRATERALAEAEFEIDPASRRAAGNIRRFVARVAGGVRSQSLGPPGQEPPHPVFAGTGCGECVKARPDPAAASPPGLRAQRRRDA